MPCQNCNSSSGSFSLPTNLNVNTCDDVYYDSQCIVYSGPNLTCMGVSTNTCLQDILQNIDTKICQNVGDYSQYNFNCLASQYVINTEADFVDAITDYTCTINTNLQTVINTTIPNLQTNLQNQINAIKNPNLSSPCSSIVYGTSSTLNQVITAISNSVCTLYTNISDISTANWNTCYSVPVPPTTLVGAFNILISQICDIKNTSTALPVFNNTTSCLPSPGATDTLVDTINKIKTRLCQTPTYNPGVYTSSCVQISGATTLDQLNQAILARIDALSQNIVNIFDSGDFTVTNVDNTDLCLGKKVALSSPSSQDRFVASTTSDSSPGTLQDKLVQGSNVTLDYVTTPGKVIINSTATGTVDDHKVMTLSSDPTPDYLGNKVEGAVVGPLAITTTIVANKVRISPVVDLEALWYALIDEANGNPILKQAICTFVNSCPIACVAPTNVSATYSVT